MTIEEKKIKEILKDFFPFVYFSIIPECGIDDYLKRVDKATEKIISIKEGKQYDN